MVAPAQAVVPPMPAGHDGPAEHGQQALPPFAKPAMSQKSRQQQQRQSGHTEQQYRSVLVSPTTQPQGKSAGRQDDPKQQLMKVLACEQTAGQHRRYDQDQRHQQAMHRAQAGNRDGEQIQWPLHLRSPPSLEADRDTPARLRGLARIPHHPADRRQDSVQSRRD